MNDQNLTPSADAVADGLACFITEDANVGTAQGSTLPRHVLADFPEEATVAAAVRSGILARRLRMIALAAGIVFAIAGTVWATSTPWWAASAQRIRAVGQQAWTSLAAVAPTDISRTWQASRTLPETPSRQIAQVIPSFKARPPVRPPAANDVPGIAREDMARRPLPPPRPVALSVASPSRANTPQRTISMARGTGGNGATDPKRTPVTRPAAVPSPIPAPPTRTANPPARAAAPTTGTTAPTNPRAELERQPALEASPVAGASPTSAAPPVAAAPTVRPPLTVPPPATRSPVQAAAQPPAATTPATIAPAERPEPPAAFNSAVASRTEQSEIQRTLGQYRNAYQTLDANAARTVWPSVDARALARAFDSLSSQQLAFDACTFDIAGASATARCTGNASYTPKIGNREPRREARQWTFQLRKEGENWKIQSAQTRR